MLSVMPAYGTLLIHNDVHRPQAFAPHRGYAGTSEGDALAARLATFAPITLAEMCDVALLDRTEVKYVMRSSLLVDVLGELRDAYSVLVVAGLRLSRYRTLYFDTGDFALYHRHHAGALNSYKVRSREYVDSNCAFLEIKHKTRGDHTIKHRVPTPELVTEFDEELVRMLAGMYPHDVHALLPCLWNTYRRITLVNKARKERVTLDINLDFGWQGRGLDLRGIAVAEVKQERGTHGSEFVSLMRSNHVRSTGFSKFCIGVSSLYPAVKHNRFKAKRRLVARLQQGGSDGASVSF